MQSISRVSGFLETARDLTLEASRNAGTLRASTASLGRTMPPQQIKKMLDSRSERDVLDALRRIIAMQYANPPQPTSAFFPAVLNTLSNPYPSTRPLVYNYLLHHAESDPDTALLSINTIQKSLNDANPRVRAMALKTMSGIRIPMISQIISLAIKKGVADLSPLVRKAAALACVKCVRLDPSTQPQVEEYISTLLKDQQYYVVGAAVQAFMEVCPEQLDMIHPVYRKLCRMVVDIDEWGQLAFLRLMIGYARRCFPTRTRKVRRKGLTQEQKARDFYDDVDEPQQDREEDFEEIQVMDEDLELLLKSVHSLLHSRNSAVIVAVARLYLYLSPQTHLGQAVGPLIALLRSPDDIRQVALYNIVQACLADPALFAPFFRHFLIRVSDASQILTLKLEILTLIFPYSGKEVQDLILAELEHFSQGHDAALVRESVKAIGRCAQFSDVKTSQRCLTLLLRQIHSPDQNLVGEAIEVVRHLIQRAPEEHKKTVVRLAKNLDGLMSSTARASVIWLVGEFANTDGDQNIAADVLRILVKGYADETDEARAQIVLLAAKVYLHYLNAKNEKQKALDALSPSKDQQSKGENGYAALSPEHEVGGFGEDAFSGHNNSSNEQDQSSSGKPDPVALLYNHTMLLARYTSSYNLRDRARMFRALLAVPSSTELASLLLLAPKPIPQAPSPSESRKDFTLGSASLVVGEEGGAGGLKGYEPVPAWVLEGQEPAVSLRDEAESTTKGTAAGGMSTYAPGKPVAAGSVLDQALEKDPGYSGQKLKKEKSLDAWLEDDDDEEDEDQSESDEESEEETDSEEEDDDEEEESEYETESEDDEKAGLVK
ncbi:ARM repeat-containing protein [Polychaeton citri CBS 116435]|uniref:ARM repeat-containing protein n=1 Tax=Polychaeton citri CBS 116435 TaxID=1314669 RepID=A0A9P4QCZ7_9PEZI|nr:ARM repeat-containing protein [Polychaeton citri CBS 116435]